MRIGSVIAAQSTLELCSQLRTMTSAPLRPVIWPAEQKYMIEMDNDKVIRFCLPQRNLVHFQCSSEHYDFPFYATVPKIEMGNYSVSLICGFVDWNGKPKAGCHRRDFSESQIEEYRNKAKRDALDHDNYPELAIFCLTRAALLEEYAFSTYASIKLKPILKYGIYSNPIPIEWPPIEIVNLRLPEICSSNEKSHGVRVQFSVCEHMRRQWYPSQQVHKLILIKEHLKGPKDAPLKPKSEKVYKVNR